MFLIRQNIIDLAKKNNDLNEIKKKILKKSSQNQSVKRRLNV